LTLVELVAGVSVLAMGVSVVMPALSSNREQGRRQQCAINQKKIIGAYALWGQDHGGFWPPRCAPADGCEEYNKVWILTEGLAGVVSQQKGTAYYTDPGLRDEGLQIVGLPETELGGEGGAANLEDYPLNTYVVPGWEFGEPFEVTHCPSDAGTIMTTSAMNSTTLARRGLAVGQVASLYEAFGTSYYTNIAGCAWEGHGDWAGSVVAQANKLQGPNFNPDLLYRPGAYVAGIDLGIVFPHWQKFVASLTGENLGDRVAGAKWHEDSAAAEGAPTWLNGNAYHADGHVTFGRRTEVAVIGAMIPVPSAQCFITAEWSLFPLKLKAQYMSPTGRAICALLGS
jgi:hypothetical protein